MASHRIPMAIFISLSFFLPYSLAGVICENLPEELCTLSISSAGRRCLLESYPRSGSSEERRCETSEVVVEGVSDWIETKECVDSCGADRHAVGISSDALLDPRFLAKLCSPACYQSCPNVVDLYFNLAAGEGVFLPDLCDVRRSNPQRSMIELVRSSGSVDAVAVGDAAAPVPST